MLVVGALVLGWPPLLFAVYVLWLELRGRTLEVLIMRRISLRCLKISILGALILVGGLISGNLLASTTSNPAIERPNGSTTQLILCGYTVKLMR